jgi:L-fuculose-phosphate aldolase
MRQLREALHQVLGRAPHAVRPLPRHREAAARGADAASPAESAARERREENMNGTRPGGRDEEALRAQVIEICARAYGRGFIQSADGNVSCRLGGPGGDLLVTPSGVNKGRLSPGDVVRTDAEGRPRRAQGKPSGEMALHLWTYRVRPDVGACVHAHPPHAIALSLAGVSLAHCLMPEVVFALGATGIPTAPYATPVTEDLPRAMEPHLRAFNAVILERHGTLTMGEGLEQAYDRLEALEHTARITVLARALGPTAPLPRAEVDRIIGLAGGIGVKRAIDACDDCGGCGRAAPVATQGADAGIAGAGPESEAALAERLRRARA